MYSSVDLSKDKIINGKQCEGLQITTKNFILLESTFFINSTWPMWKLYQKSIFINVHMCLHIEQRQWSEL